MPVTTQIFTQGWLVKVHGILKQCQPVPSEITVQNGLLLRGQRIIITHNIFLFMIQLHCLNLEPSLFT